jgi:Ca2+-binding EF-hand superfamily protein
MQQALQTEKRSLEKAQSLLKEQILLVKQNVDGLQKNSGELHEKGFVSKKPGVFLPEVPEANGTQDEDEPGHEIAKELLYYLDEQRMTLRKFFQSIDDGNGRIEKHEWMDGLKMIRYCNESVELRRARDCAELFGCVDEDFTGSISWKELEQYFDELLKVVRSKHPVGAELVIFLKDEGWTLRKLWQVLDESGDGKLDIDEMLTGMRTVGFMNESHVSRNTAVCKEFFLSTDTDRSGIISWHEFQGVLSELQNGARCSKVKKLNQVATKKLHQLKDLQRNAISLRDKAHELIRTTTSECSLNLRHVMTETNKQADDLSNQLKKLKFLKSQTEARLKNQLRLLQWKDHAEIHQDDGPKERACREYNASPELIQDANMLETAPVEEIDKESALAVLEGVLAKLNADIKDKSEALEIDQNCRMARIVGDNLTLKPTNCSRTGPGEISHGSLASTSDTVASAK